MRRRSSKTSCVLVCVYVGAREYGGGVGSVSKGTDPVDVGYLFTKSGICVWVGLLCVVSGLSGCVVSVWRAVSVFV